MESELETLQRELNEAKRQRDRSVEALTHFVTHYTVCDYSEETFDEIANIATGLWGAVKERDQLRAELNEAKANQKTADVESNFAELELKKIRGELEKEKQWKIEDPRMLREQIRVADVAFNALHKQHQETQAELEMVRGVSVDTFVDNLITTLESHGIDLTNCDGDEEPHIIIAGGIASVVSELHAERAKWQAMFNEAWSLLLSASDNLKPEAVTLKEKIDGLRFRFNGLDKTFPVEKRCDDQWRAIAKDLASLVKDSLWELQHNKAAMRLALNRFNEMEKTK